VFSWIEEASEVTLDLQKYKTFDVQSTNKTCIYICLRNIDLHKTNEQRLSLFERKVLRCIFGANQQNGTWRRRYNYELYETFKEPTIVNPALVPWGLCDPSPL
jgi:hypothetical protein